MTENTYKTASSQVQRIGSYWEGIEGAALGALKDTQDELRNKIRQEGGNPFGKNTLFGQLAVSEGVIDTDTLADSVYAQGADRINAALTDISAMQAGEVSPEQLNAALPGYIGGKFRMDTFETHILDDANVAFGDIARNMVRAVAQNPEYADRIMTDLTQLQEAMVNMNSFGVTIGAPMAYEALDRLKSYDLSVNVTGRDGENFTITSDKVASYLDTAKKVIKEGGDNTPSLAADVLSEIGAVASGLKDTIVGKEETTNNVPRILDGNSKERI